MENVIYLWILIIIISAVGLFAIARYLLNKLKEARLKQNGVTINKEAIIKTLYIIDHLGIQERIAILQMMFGGSVNISLKVVNDKIFLMAAGKEEAFTSNDTEQIKSYTG